MAEWGIPFDHIEEHWTDSQYLMMLERLRERLEARLSASDKAQGIQRFNIDTSR
jgi:hypothetical protein